MWTAVDILDYQMKEFKAAKFDRQTDFGNQQLWIKPTPLKAGSRVDFNFNNPLSEILNKEKENMCDNYRALDTSQSIKALVDYRGTNHSA